MLFFKRFCNLFLLCLLLSSTSFFAQKKHLEVYELFDVSLEELLSVGIVSASKKKQSVNREIRAPASPAGLWEAEYRKIRTYRKTF